MSGAFSFSPANGRAFLVRSIPPAGQSGKGRARPVVSCYGGLGPTGITISHRRGEYASRVMTGLGLVTRDFTWFGAVRAAAKPAHVQSTFSFTTR